MARVPDFTLPDQARQDWHLAEHRDAAMARSGRMSELREDARRMNAEYDRFLKPCNG